MFEDFYTMLADWRTSIDSILEQKISDKAEASVDTVARAALREILLELGMDAIESVEDFQYEPLRDRFREMLSRPSHVSIERGVIKKAFNERVAGDFSDLIAGMNAAGGHTGSKIAPYIWKFGVYKPRWEGTEVPTSLRKLDPDYERTVDERLAAWDDKAPYWLLVNFGTTAFADPERAYPQITGQHFVEKFRMIAPVVIQRAQLVYLKNVADSVGADVSEILNTPRKGATVTVVRIPVGDQFISVRESSAGNIFFRIGRVGLTFQQAVAAVKRAYR